MTRPTLSPNSPPHHGIVNADNADQLCFEDLLFRGINDKLAEDILNYRVWASQAFFCGHSGALFSLLYHGKLPPVHAKRAQDFYDHCASLTSKERHLLSQLERSSAESSKPSKVGYNFAEAQRIAGPFANEVAACFLNEMALSLCSFVLRERESLMVDSILSIALHHARGCLPQLAASAVSRVCFEPSPLLLRRLLNAFGPDGLGLTLHGDTPLHMACRHHSISAHDSKKLPTLECATLLIQAGADLELPNACGTTALGVAASCGFREACDLLLDHGADSFVRLHVDHKNNSVSNDSLVIHSLVHIMPERAQSILAQRDLREQVREAGARPHKPRRI